ncbi:hypothetical protein OIU85_024204 [Salix viminalis]|uniref:Uncharacterized protein n=1 Tax=Salix viminalis TaxID=40686 RepID=A0A9Q0U085_SALVM|nr:hypothetical protein OIU85_024204 [Salix viminalis]
MQKHLLSLLMKREASLLIHFTVFDHQEEDLPKKKEAEPVLVRLQRVSDARHLDDFSLIKTLRARMRESKEKSC